MSNYQKILCPYNGILEKIFINEGEYVYEWEPLFLIKTTDGLLFNVDIGVSGVVSKINVHPGDQVFLEMELAYLKGDTLPNGCD